MSTEEIFGKVKDIIAKELQKDTGVSMETRFEDDLGADSLSVVEMIMNMEEEFGVDIPDEDAEKIKTVGDAVNYIAAKV